MTPLPSEGLTEGFIVSDGLEIAWVAKPASRTPIVTFTEFDDTRPVTSDRRGGIVFTHEDALYRLQPGQVLPTSLDWVPVPQFPTLNSIGDVALPFAGPIVVVGDYDDSGVTRIVDLGDEGLLPEVDDFLAAIAQLRPLEVRIEEVGSEPDESEEPDYRDHTPAYLVVTPPTDTELLRIRMSTEAEPAVWIDDFDGRRVLVTRSPTEPASAPQTSFLIDLACGWSCTEMYWSPAEADLSIAGFSDPDEAATLDANQWRRFLSCSAGGLSVEPEAQPLLPDSVARTRASLTRAVAECALPTLEFRAATDETHLGTAGFAGGLTIGEAAWAPYAETGTLLERLIGTPPLAGMHAALQFPYAQLNDAAGEVTFLWPAIADPTLDWEAMTNAEAAALAEIYGSGIIDQSREQGEYHSAWWIEIDEAGAWKEVGYIWD